MEAEHEPESAQWNLVVRAEALEAKAPGLDRDLDLLLLYWQSTDPGISTGHRLPAEFLHHAGDRYQELLGVIESRYPRSTAARFWTRYIRWIDGDSDITCEYCEQLLQEDPTTLVPALYLIMSNPSPRRRELAQRLRSQQERKTMRSEYIASVLEGALR